ncbi:MAG: BlaI/MecI/CopY family transcriptional regulator [Bdellovibrionales bacterium]|nr:BlaI/MecI/CopY family transcriptional regulator [Bdellovibrionales bacterium]
MANKLLEVGPLELEVLGILNTAGEQSVSDIQTHLKNSGHDLAYTTVMTVLVRLYNKDLVTRKKDGRLFLYAAAKKKDSSAQSIFEKVKNSLFRSERLTPILSLLDNEDDLTREELEELKKAVEQRLKRT